MSKLDEAISELSNNLGEYYSVDQAHALLLEIQQERATYGRALEARAVALVKQFNFLLPQTVKVFFRDIANYLEWQTLKGNL